MRVALGIPRILPDDLTANLTAMQQMIQTASTQAASLIVFSEAALTGLTNIGVPEYDLQLGQTIPGPATGIISAAAQKHKIWVGFGLFERENDTLYDSAVLIAPAGSIRLKYRRIDPHWHHWHSRPCSNMVYQYGTQVDSIVMPLGRCAFLLCGDLFNATCLEMLIDVDWLIVPMARCFDSDVKDAPQWYAEERHYYARQGMKAGVNMLLVNQLSQHADGDYFGGATVFTRTGEVNAEYPLQQPGMLVVDL